MADLESLIKKRGRAVDYDSFTPVIFDLKKPARRRALLRLFAEKKIDGVIDDLAVQEGELALVKNPRRMTYAIATGVRPKNPPLKPKSGVWVYYPWRKVLVHLLDKNNFRRLRLSRNLNLILPKEQEKISRARVGIAGLNVGNPAALCLSLEGFVNFKFADFDLLSVSNFNRFRASLADLAVNKAILSARQVYETDPFTKLEIFPQGIQPDNIDDFLFRPRLDVLVEETDNLKLKVAIREKARLGRIPVVMVTGNGPTVIVDVERYDENPRLKILNGHLRPKVVRKIFALEPGKGIFKERVKLARDFMGVRHLTPRLVQSFSLVGKRLAGIPQLAEASYVRGAAVTHFVRHIILGNRVPSGRYLVKIDRTI